MNWSPREIKKEAARALRPDYWHIWFGSALLMVLTYFTLISFMLNSANELPDTLKNLTVRINSADRKQIIAVIFVLVMGVFALNTLIQLLISVFFKYPIQVGARKLFLEIWQSEDGKGKTADLMFAFDNHYRNIVWIMLVRVLRELVYGLLLVIPGIWRAYTYRMVPYILSENPGMSIEYAFNRSIELVKGHKWRLFLYDLSFIPWHILGILTFGIVELFWVHPYKNMADAKLYLLLKNAGKTV